jgi:hypothetical protein
MRNPVLAYTRRVVRCTITAALCCSAIPFAALASDGTAAPVKLAVFEFELEDLSAGAGVTGQSGADTANLQAATSTAQKLFEESGRYVLVSTSNSDARPAREHTLHRCNGCEAGIALQLGAEQSFTGVVSRIGRTEYTVRFEIRDARTGAVIAAQNTDLRMGANYSWDRGAASLVKRALLEKLGQR